MATLQTPVFLINSRLGRFSAARFSSPRVVVHLTRAPLLPKLRGHFAEFLLRKSLEHLRLLASPTCVRLGTVTESTSLRGFSWQYAPQPFAGPYGPFGIGARLLRTDLPVQKHLPPYIGYSTTRRSLLLLRPPLGSNALLCGTGILTRFPSPTRLGLSLGTD